MNNLTVPKGGQYQIILPDGTKVWLNAASTLKYPNQFNHTERKVELQGEAFFEVIRNPNQPFIVLANNKSITVLGTSFNVNSYNDESSTTTTLVEGKVKIENTATTGKINKVILIPGEQASFSNANFTVTPVITEDYTSWKDGQFTFNNLPLKTITRQIERWFDVKFIYQTDPKDVKLWGSIFRDTNFSTILNVLEINTSFKYEIKGRKIIVKD